MQYNAATVERFVGKVEAHSTKVHVANSAEEVKLA